MKRIDLATGIKNLGGYIGDLERVYESAQILLKAEENGSTNDRFSALAELEKRVGEVTFYISDFAPREVER